MEKKENSNLKEPKKRSENELLQFFIGIVLIGVGLFMLSKRVMVHSSWYIWRIGGFDLSSGTVTVPLLIGIVWYFCNNKSIAAKILIVLGIIFIVATFDVTVFPDMRGNPAVSGSGPRLNVKMLRAEFSIALRMFRRAFLYCVAFPVAFADADKSFFV